MSDQPEYTLKKSITSYNYPPHMKRPEGWFGSNFFEKWIPNWEAQLAHLVGKPNVVGVEVGCLYGDCTVFCADKIANGEGSKIFAIDINENEFLTNNLAPYRPKRVEFMRARSYDALRSGLIKEQSADYVYIDGSHLAIDVLSDAVLSWSLLKDDAILIFDDYGWGAHTNDEKQKPKLAIDAFLSAYQGHYQMLYNNNWQIFIKKLHYEYSKEELEANYQK